MGYTTFEFYKNSYYGDSVEESLFPKWEDKASMKLDQLTYGNINDDTRTEFDERIQKATCALADLLYQIDYKTTHANDAQAGNVKSMSSVSQSALGATKHLLIRC